MVGGKVREVFRLGDKIDLLVQEEGNAQQFWAVELVDRGDAIVPGDSVRWQDDKLLWNPKDGRWLDKEIERSSHIFDGDQLWRQAALLAKQGICPVCSEEELAMADGKGSIYCNVCGASYDLSAMLTEED